MTLTGSRLRMMDDAQESDFRLSDGRSLRLILNHETSLRSLAFF
jgi:hypothetical protein